LCLFYTTTLICILRVVKDAVGIYRDRIKNESNWINVYNIKYCT